MPNSHRQAGTASPTRSHQQNRSRSRSSSNPLLLNVSAASSTASASQSQPSSPAQPHPPALPAGTATASSSKWHQIRPWAPPVSGVGAEASGSSAPSFPSSSSTPSTTQTQEQVINNPRHPQTKLQLLDLTPTSLALSLLLPSPSPINIQLDGQTWPHVALVDGAPSADSSHWSHEPTSSGNGASVSAGGAGENVGAVNQGTERSVVVYGLEEGRGYQIGVEVLSGTTGTGPGHRASSSSSSTASLVGTGLNSVAMAAVGGEVVAEDEAPDEMEDADDEHPSTDPDAPPPYSPHPTPSTHPTPAALRALLKTLRTDSKRSETNLQASISALRKAVEKGLKEDQRARTRIVSLEEGLRKAEEGERDALPGGEERESVEEELLRLLEEEKEWIEILAERKARKTSGHAASSSVIAAPAPLPSGADKEAASEGTKSAEMEAGNTTPTVAAAQPPSGHEEHGGGVSEVAKELEALNRALEDKERERKDAKDRLRALEVELGKIEGEMLQMDREEAHRIQLANHGGSHVNNHLPPNNGGGGPFNLKQWGRGPRAPGRFWRRSTQNYAVEHQNMWANTASSPPLGVSPNGGMGMESGVAPLSMISSALDDGLPGPDSEELDTVVVPQTTTMGSFVNRVQGWGRGGSQA